MAAPPQNSASSPNRAIVLTGPGAAALAVVRLVGPDTTAFLERHFSRPVAPGRCVHGELRDEQRIIDDPVIALGADGQCADITFHGNPWIVQVALELAAREGFAIIHAVEGPAPLDAVDGDDPMAREVSAYLPLCQSDLAARALLAQPRAWHEFRRSAADAAALRAIGDDRGLYWLLHPPRVAIVGAANVGKSTLANALFERSRSITADAPGTTRDWVDDMALVDGVAVRLMDTPGQRDTADAIERLAIDHSRAPIDAADLVLLMLDVTRPLAGEQQALIDRYPAALRAANKSDQPAKWAADAANAIAISALRNEGFDRLKRSILAHFQCENYEIHRPRCWTARQDALLQSALTDRSALGSI